MWEEVEHALNDSTTRVVTGIAKLLPGFLGPDSGVLISLVIATFLFASCCAAPCAVSTSTARWPTGSYRGCVETSRPKSRAAGLRCVLVRDPDRDPNRHRRSLTRP